MKYVYGISTRFGEPRENLKTIADEHTNLSGYIQTVTELVDGTKITDRCRIIEKYASKEENGVCYDWYIIDSHYRETDNSAQAQAKVDQINANIDYLFMMSGIDIPTEGEATNG